MCPTIVNNVETLCAVKHIVAMGGAEYAKLGTPNNTGTRIVSLSGHVKQPGYYEVEVGKVTMGELINDPAFGGGLRDGRKLKAIIPGGSSAKVFKAGEKFKLKRRGPDGKETEQEVDMLDLPYDFDSLIAAGSMSGSGAIIVLDDSADIVEALANISEFYAHESCGQCTPCREGSLWMAKALHRLTHGEGRAGRRGLPGAASPTTFPAAGRSAPLAKPAPGRCRALSPSSRTSSSPKARRTRSAAPGEGAGPTAEMKLAASPQVDIEHVHRRQQLKPSPRRHRSRRSR